ncbi:hypothetical protein SEUBUCD646_0D02010 [Saccharomyces eubayanus]|uniref:snRNA-associated protein n=2 Tax=Saccharomyces TaxID=4930 RepID=A0A6C1E618_SACPS|nr:snRNA-associated protein [Saccharomyces pastorianus]CAI1904601.1 hypothetical protein SEUBUCD650_0D02000 [Saccharomyces eubayanus]CAI1937623.1 hypothetical protein SEUBUCD646_0D02010 [Saccharomyces eubayanus]
MEHAEGVGSKKGGGGIASESQFKLQRKKEVESLLSKGEEVPYTFQDEQDDQVRSNPYIYKNHSGKLVCKLCNTMHMSWSSVERHLGGKKHGLNVLRRGISIEKTSQGRNGQAAQDFQHQQKIIEAKQSLKNNGVVPASKIAAVKDPKTGLVGLAIQVNYNINDKEYDASGSDKLGIPPLIRIVSGLELSDPKQKGKKFLIIAYEPFENIAIELPPNEITFGKDQEIEANMEGVDELNRKCTVWDSISRLYYIQFFFKQAEEDQVAA